MRKGQAAMEYLMTYGWAILIIIVVVAALYAMGVFKVGKATVPCSPCFSYFAYVDHSSDTLIIRNGPQELSAIYVSVGGNNIYTSTNTITPGQQITISSAGTFGGDVTVDITYTVAASGLNHTDTATLHAV